MKLVKRPWSDEIAGLMAEALAGDDQSIKDDCLNGRADVWEVPGRGHLILRVDDQRELVIVAAQGKGLFEVVKELMNHYRNRFESVRVHSSKKGMGRLLARLGFSEVQRVYRVELNGQ